MTITNGGSNPMMTNMVSFKPYVVIVGPIQNISKMVGQAINRSYTY